MIFEPGETVFGPFWSDDDRPRGIGIVVASGREVWTRVPEGYVAVRVIVGDRVNGGYKPESLRPSPSKAVQR